MNSNVNGAASLSMAIGRFVSGLEFGALSPTDLTTLKFGIMDCLACVIAGAREPVTRMVLDTIVPGAGEDKKATVLAHSVQSSALGAALANGVMAHACDFDDVSDPMCGHPTAPALPAILAAGELTDRSGRDVLLAYAAAIEVMTKLGRASGYELYQSGWHATAALGVFGAAAGAAKILGLDAEHTATAIGIAASRVAGIRANIGSMVKPMHCGFAARDGLEAALLAAAGATASPNALEGTNGFLNTYISQGGRSTDVASLLGNPFDIREPGIVFKKYPSCLDTHSAIDAILELRNRHNIQPEHVRSIRCVLAPGVGGDLAYHAPQAPMEGKFSMEFCSAVALARGRVSLAEFSQEVVDDPVIQRLINISNIDFDPELTSPNPRSFCAAARVEISLEDGRVIDKTVQYMRGHPENPMAGDEFVSKFEDCARSVLSPANTARALAAIEQMDRLSDLRVLMSALVAD
ncbi:MAG: MmgE/PrpD family protein [Mesorhizobium sp.]|uniref:MmgE/PrpD family protein n=1 Tax=unclassified Mesorhizobium TaxID=325217 RepID=UPI000FC9E13C|nr:MULTISPECIES: MmgE/PrpD family protein [unclassified Mesorhizobium]RUU99043.1 MmgE/PrpD family protein [Mesorhizobium sp. M6A.T.Cr.TU.017.01.1.1]RUV71188.1 MmgE/PrpD family protein [Mesorhizobium sp. M5C.F.Cr.IN.023.01.1.1]RWD22750.1 MAG: MmgE/PrpD family protein [Mesorhizobium sp.]